MMRRVLAIVLGVAIGLPLCGNAAQFPFSGSSQARQTKPSSVRFLYPEQISIAAGKPVQLELHFKVAEGLHINSHTPREDVLIPTNLKFPDMPGVKIVSVDYPNGSDFAFSFDTKNKLSVYTGEFVVKVKLETKAGDHLLQGGLRYQACDTNSCMPPRTIPVAIDVQAK